MSDTFDTIPNNSLYATFVYRPGGSCERICMFDGQEISYAEWWDIQTAALDRALLGTVEG